MKSIEELIELVKSLVISGTKLIKMVNDNHKESQKIIKTFLTQKNTILQYIEQFNKETTEMTLNKKSEIECLKLEGLRKINKKQAEINPVFNRSFKQKIYYKVKKEELDNLTQYVKERLEPNELDQFLKIEDTLEKLTQLKLIYLDNEFSKCKEQELRIMLKFLRNEFQQICQSNKPKKVDPSSEEKMMTNKLKKILKHLNVEYTEGKNSTDLYLLEMIELKLYNLKLEAIPKIKKQNQLYAQQIKKLNSELEQIHSQNKQFETVKRGDQGIMYLEKKKLELETVLQKIFEQLQEICINNELIKISEYEELRYQTLIDTLQRFIKQSKEKQDRINIIDSENQMQLKQLESRVKEKYESRIADNIRIIEMLQAQNMRLDKRLENLEEEFEVLLSEKLGLEKELQQLKQVFKRQRQILMQKTQTQQKQLQTDLDQVEMTKLSKYTTELQGQIQNKRNQIMHIETRLQSDKVSNALKLDEIQLLYQKQVNHLNELILFNESKSLSQLAKLKQQHLLQMSNKLSQMNQSHRLKINQHQLQYNKVIECHHEEVQRLDTLRKMEYEQISKHLNQEKQKYHILQKLFDTCKQYFIDQLKSMNGHYSTLFIKNAQFECRKFDDIQAKIQNIQRYLINIKYKLNEYRCNLHSANRSLNEKVLYINQIEDKNQANLSQIKELRKQLFKEEKHKVIFDQSAEREYEFLKQENAQLKETYEREFKANITIISKQQNQIKMYQHMINVLRTEKAQTKLPKFNIKQFQQLKMRLRCWKQQLSEFKTQVETKSREIVGLIKQVEVVSNQSNIKQLQLIKILKHKFKITTTDTVQIARLISECQVAKRDNTYYQILEKLVQELLFNKVNLNLQQQMKQLSKEDKDKIKNYKRKVADIQSLIVDRDGYQTRLKVLEEQLESKNTRINNLEQELKCKQEHIMDLQRNKSGQSIQASMFLIQQQGFQGSISNINQLLDQSVICNDELYFIKTELSKCMKEIELINRKHDQKLKHIIRRLRSLSNELSAVDQCKINILIEQIKETHA